MERQTFLFFTILPDTLLLFASGLGSVLHLGDVSPIVQQEVIVHVLQLVHGLHVLQPTESQHVTPCLQLGHAQNAQGMCSDSGQAEEELLDSSPKRILSISHYWLCGCSAVARAAALFGQVYGHLKSFWNEYRSPGTLPLHVSSIQGPYSISQGLVWVSRDLLILVGLHLLKQSCQVLLTDLQLGPLT